jgi:peroxiredoxin
MRIAVAGILGATLLLAAVPAAGQEGGAKNAKRPAPPPAGVKIGEKVPDFAVADLSGKTLRLSDLQKKSKSGVVMITFWCTICSSCRQIDEKLEKMHQANRENAAIYALDCGDAPKAIVDFQKMKGLTFPVVKNNPSSLLQALFGVNATTTTVVIDSKGVLQYWGRFDDKKANASYAQDALSAILANQPAPVRRTNAVG